MGVAQAVQRGLRLFRRGSSAVPFFRDGIWFSGESVQSCEYKRIRRGFSGPNNLSSCVSFQCSRKSKTADTGSVIVRLPYLFLVH